ncbi:MAG: addiction module toxin, HicA family [Xenococcus sp. (in: cyanobacteria)]
MKRRDLISQLEKSGCYLIIRGGKHDIYHNLNNGKAEKQIIKESDNYETASLAKVF